jgi:DnaK suppressor protein
MEEELTDAQLQELGRALHDLEASLLADLDQSAGSAETVELDQSKVGRLSRMDAMQQQAMAQATRRNLMLSLRQCRAAQVAMNEGEYGICRKCDEEIGYKRLSVRPESPMCIACQRQADHR